MHYLTQALETAGFDVVFNVDPSSLRNDQAIEQVDKNGAYTCTLRRAGLWGVVKVPSPKSAPPWMRQEGAQEQLQRVLRKISSLN